MGLRCSSPACIARWLQSNWQLRAAATYHGAWMFIKPTALPQQSSWEGRGSRRRGRRMHADRCWAKAGLELHIRVPCTVPSPRQAADALSWPLTNTTTSSLASRQNTSFPSQLMIQQPVPHSVSSAAAEACVAHRDVRAALWDRCKDGGRGAPTARDYGLSAA